MTKRRGEWEAGVSISTKLKRPNDDKGSILRNSISAENFSGHILIL
jgi:hypothetical protein